MMAGPPRLATRLFAAQVVVVATAVLGVVGAAMIAGPGLFHEHVTRAAMAGAQVAEASTHVEEAFASSFAFAVTVGATASLGVAAWVAWVVARRIARPVEALARVADRVAVGDSSRPARVVPGAKRAREATDARVGGFAAEIDHLMASFAAMDARLAASDRARARLLADLAHELRTPLATLQAYVDGLEDGVLPADAASWQVMRVQVSRMGRLAEDLRDVAAAEERAIVVAPAPLPIADVVAEAVGAARPRYAAKGVDLRAGPVARVTIAGDAVRLQQVMGNLLDNALRHVPSGGHVVVEATARDGGIDVRVRDDGEGIAPGDLDVIFERFRRGNPSRAASDGSGSGLGLTIARAIARAHGGTLVAVSDGLGRGATFTLRLPVVGADGD